ncbi:hypothetical protein ACA910_002339 [Epithemia clementina (nom. ined.)]
MSLQSDQLTNSFLSMGPSTYQVSLMDLFASNRKRLTKEIHRHVKGDNDSSTCEYVLYMVGGESTTRYDSDHEPIFRQESYFWYLTGVKEPDCQLILDFSLSSTTCWTVLLVPRLPAEYATIMGAIKTPAQWKTHYQVDEVRFTDEIDHILEQRMLGNQNGGAVGAEPKNRTLLRLKGPNSDSGKLYEPPAVPSSLQDMVNDELLFPILAECRVIKSSAELALLRHATEVTSFGHGYVMRNIKPGMMEYQGESLFRHYCYFNFGSRLTGYTSICGCGPNAAILHYGHAGEPNARQTKSGEICLFDMGAEYFCYGSDVTCSFPINGKFSQDQLSIYSAVLSAQKAVYEMIKPGVSWVDCHKTAELEILKGLHSIGIVKTNDNISLEDLVELRLGAVFMPHGLGHFIGIDTHDVGGYLTGLNPPCSTKPGLKLLRTARVLKESMTLTVEPGCYFIDHLLNEALAEESPLRPYLDPKVVEKYRGFGGVRLEDVVVVTKDGCENFTLCPRTPKEVEAVMGGANWPPIRDEAPELRRLRLTDPTTAILPSPPSM